MSAAGPRRSLGAAGSAAAGPSAFDIFTQEKQDAWLDGMQAKIARALGGPPPEQDNWPWNDGKLSPLRASSVSDHEDAAVDLDANGVDWRGHSSEQGADADADMDAQGSGLFSEDGDEESEDGVETNGYNHHDQDAAGSMDDPEGWEENDNDYDDDDREYPEATPYSDGAPPRTFRRPDQEPLFIGSSDDEDDAAEEDDDEDEDNVEEDEDVQDVRDLQDEDGIPTPYDDDNAVPTYLPLSTATAYSDDEADAPYSQDEEVEPALFSPARSVRSEKEEDEDEEEEDEDEEEEEEDEYAKEQSEPDEYALAQAQSQRHRQLCTPQLSTPQLSTPHTPVAAFPSPRSGLGTSDSPIALSSDSEDDGDEDDEDSASDGSDDCDEGSEEDDRSDSAATGTREPSAAGDDTIHVDDEQEEYELLDTPQRSSLPPAPASFAHAPLFYPYAHAIPAHNWDPLAVPPGAPLSHEMIGDVLDIFAQQPPIPLPMPTEGIAGPVPVISVETHEVLGMEIDPSLLDNFALPPFVAPVPVPDAHSQYLSDPHLRAHVEDEEDPEAPHTPHYGGDYDMDDGADAPDEPREPVVEEPEEPEVEEPEEEEPHASTDDVEIEEIPDEDEDAELPTPAAHKAHADVDVEEIPEAASPNGQIHEPDVVETPTTKAPVPVPAAMSPTPLDHLSVPGDSSRVPSERDELDDSDADDDDADDDQPTPELRVFDGSSTPVHENEPREPSHDPHADVEVETASVASRMTVEPERPTEIESPIPEEDESAPEVVEPTEVDEPEDDQGKDDKEEAEGDEEPIEVSSDSESDEQPEPDPEAEAEVEEPEAEGSESVATEERSRSPTNALQLDDVDHEDIEVDEPPQVVVDRQSSVDESLEDQLDEPDDEEEVRESTPQRESTPPRDPTPPPENLWRHNHGPAGRDPTPEPIPVASSPATISQPLPDGEPATEPKKAHKRSRSSIVFEPLGITTRSHCSPHKVLLKVGPLSALILVPGCRVPSAETLAKETSQDFGLAPKDLATEETLERAYHLTPALYQKAARMFGLSAFHSEELFVLEASDGAIEKEPTHTRRISWAARGTGTPDSRDVTPRRAVSSQPMSASASAASASRRRSRASLGRSPAPDTPTLGMARLPSGSASAPKRRRTSLAVDSLKPKPSSTPTPKSKAESAPESESQQDAQHEEQHQDKDQEEDIADLKGKGKARAKDLPPVPIVPTPSPAKRLVAFSEPETPKRYALRSLGDTPSEAAAALPEIPSEGEAESSAAAAARAKSGSVSPATATRRVTRSMAHEDTESDDDEDAEGGDEGEDEAEDEAEVVDDEDDDDSDDDEDEEEDDDEPAAQPAADPDGDLDVDDDQADDDQPIAIDELSPPVASARASRRKRKADDVPEPELDDDDDEDVEIATEGPRTRSKRRAVASATNEDVPEPAPAGPPAAPAEEAQGGGLRRWVGRFFRR